MSAGKHASVRSEAQNALSEYPPGTLSNKFHFPKRNRIIAGLSDILYVIDTGKNSGTKTTVQAAERYGKVVCFK